MNKVHARGKRSKPAERDTAKAPGEGVREQQARIKEALKVPVPPLPEHAAGSAAGEAFAAASRALAEMPVPMTLGEICQVIGSDVDPERFASSALSAIADQLNTTAALVETDHSNDSWRLFKNLSLRAELASRVAGWLEAETTEVHP